MPPKRSRPPSDDPSQSEDPGLVNDPHLADAPVTMADMLNAFNALSQRLQALEKNHDSITPSEPSDQEDTPISPPRKRHRDPKVASPTPFTGKASEFQNFLAQCTLVLTVCVNTYVTDEEKVLFMISHMKEDPLTWARDIVLDPLHPLRHDYLAFRAAFSNVYDDRAYKADAEDKLQRLTQTGSASSYAQKFQSLASALELNDAAQCIMFYGGLKPEVKRAIITAGRASPLYSLVDQAVNFDQLFYQQNLQEKRVTSQSGPSVPPKPSSSLGPKPSQFRPPLTQEEKDYRRNNGLCLYCGKSGHTADNCPAKKNSTQKPGTPSPVSNLNGNVPTSPPIYPVPLRPGSAASASSHSENWMSHPQRM